MSRRIESRLQEVFKPDYLDVLNVSDKHQGHAGSNDSGESHYVIYILAPAFEGKPRLEVHRLIYDCLDDLFEETLHALSIKLRKK